MTWASAAYTPCRAPAKYPQRIGATCSTPSEEADFQGDAVLEIKPLTPVRIAQQTDEFFATCAQSADVMG